MPCVWCQVTWAQLAGPAAAWSPMGPFRLQHFAPENRPLWVAAGYHAADVNEFLAAYQVSGRAAGVVAQFLLDA